MYRIKTANFETIQEKNQGVLVGNSWQTTRSSYCGSKTHQISAELYPGERNKDKGPQASGIMRSKD
jgi:hypothetical protein